MAKEWLLPIGIVIGGWFGFRVVPILLWLWDERERRD